MSSLLGKSDLLAPYIYLNRLGQDKKGASTAIVTMLAKLRSGLWLTPGRLRTYPIIILIAACLELPLAFGFGVHSPPGIDFVATWAAAHASVNGSDFYDPTVALATQSAADGISDFFPFPYPPTYVLITAPFGLLPYYGALALWSGAGFVGFLTAMLNCTGRRGLLSIVAFPAIIINLLNGQNGLLLASLAIAGLTTLESSPVLAGIFIGAMSIKPQLGLAIPFALLAGRHFRTYIAATATVATLVAVSLIVFGVTPWREFFAMGNIYRGDLLEAGNPILAKVVTVFASSRRMGIDSTVAYVFQISTAVVAILSVVVVWRSNAPRHLKNAVLIFAGPLVVPYLFDYDLATLGLGIAAMAMLGLQRGFLPWEKTALALLWILPGIARPLTIFTHLPVVPACMVLALSLIIRRIGPSGQAPNTSQLA